MKYKIEFLIERGWWNKKEHKPHNSLITGNTETILNLGWFKALKNQKYELTPEGQKQYKILLANHHQATAPEEKGECPLCKKN